MSYLSAAEAVLRRAGRPMTLREITRQAIKSGLIRPQGGTPEMTMSAALYRDLKERPDGPIERQYQPGQMRARRNSVRWLYVGGE